MWFRNKLISVCSVLIIGHTSFVLAETDTVEYASTVTLSSLTQNVYDIHPALHSELAQQQQINANADLANEMFADVSTINLTHQNDVLGSGNGLQEWEGSLNMPLWLSGQKQLQQSLSDKMSAVLPAYQQKIKLDASGKVRELIWKVILADNKQQQAFQAWQTALKLKQDVAARVKAGEFAKAELLLVNTNAIELHGQYLLTQAELKHALKHYQQITGQSTLPEDYEETLLIEPSADLSLDALVELIQQHPDLALQDQQIETLRTKQGLAQFDGAVNPILSVGVRRERGNDNENFTNSIGLGISFALDSKVYRRPSMTNAAKELADAEIVRQILARELSLTLFAKLHDLETKQAQLLLAIENDETTQRYFSLQKRAFELGEIDLVDVLRTQALANKSHNRQQLLKIEIKQLIANINQASGAIL